MVAPLNIVLKDKESVRTFLADYYFGGIFESLEDVFPQIITGVMSLRLHYAFFSPHQPCYPYPYHSGTHKALKIKDTKGL